MERKILIVGSTDQSNAQSVSKNIEAWSSFFHSSYAGAWEDSEISVFVNTTKAKIIEAISYLKNIPYCVIVYIGHGFSKLDDMEFNETFLNLNNQEFISEREINPKNNKCLMIFDESNITYNTEIYNSDSLQGAGSRDAYTFQFNNELTKCENGCCKVVASSFKYQTNTKTSFSLALLCTTLNWIQVNKGILTIQDAINYTVKNLILPSNVIQYQGGRRLFHFPFVINI